MRNLGIAFAAGRIAFGVVYLLAPARAGRGWLGAVADAPAASVPIRSVGARDLVLGAGALVAVLRGSGARLWFAAHAASDAADVAGTLAVRRALPHDGVPAVAVAGASAAIAIALALRV